MKKHIVYEKYIVYEYTEKARPQYWGTRFMIVDNGDMNPNLDDKLKIVGRGLGEHHALALCEQMGEKNIDAFLDDIPNEIRSSKIDEILRKIIRGM